MNQYHLSEIRYQITVQLTTQNGIQHAPEDETFVIKQAELNFWLTFGTHYTAGVPLCGVSQWYWWVVVGGGGIPDTKLGDGCAGQLSLAIILLKLVKYSNG